MGTGHPATAMSARNPPSRCAGFWRTIALRLVRFSRWEIACSVACTDVFHRFLVSNTTGSFRRAADAASARGSARCTPQSETMVERYCAVRPRRTAPLLLLPWCSRRPPAASGRGTWSLQPLGRRPAPAPTSQSRSCSTCPACTWRWAGPRSG